MIKKTSFTYLIGHTKNHTVQSNDNNTQQQEENNTICYQLPNNGDKPVNDRWPPILGHLKT